MVLLMLSQTAGRALKTDFRNSVLNHQGLMKQYTVTNTNQHDSKARFINSSHLDSDSSVLIGGQNAIKMWKITTSYSMAQYTSEHLITVRNCQCYN